MIMAVVTLRLNEQEQEFFKKYADFTGQKLSTLFKDALLEKIEDAYDLKIAEQALVEYEKNPVSYSVEEMREKYDF